LQSNRYQVRAAGERQAMNAGIQGLAADIFKVALVRLAAQLEERGLTSRLVLQVHDEVLVESPRGGNTSRGGGHRCLVRSGRAAGAAHRQPGVGCHVGGRQTLTPAQASDEPTPWSAGVGADDVLQHALVHVEDSSLRTWCWWPGSGEACQLAQQPSRKSF